ncbi:unnamed protein product, partial [Iphiclides podalirius]
MKLIKLNRLDGTQLVVGAGEKVMVYDPRDGALVQLLQAHKAAVYAVAYCGDGKKFASGSADKNVIIWTSKMEGVLKYSHSEPIQCLAYNPVSLHLASCALSDFAFWSADVKAVQKYRVTGRITSCAWSSNGQFLAIGLAIGAVSLRNKIGDEVQLIQREAPVWAVTFLKTTLLVSDWNDTLSFYNVQGQQVLKDRNIGISALSLSVFDAVVLVGGMGGWAVLTNEGISMLSTQQEWVWAITPSKSHNTLAVACQDGSLWCYQVVFSTVHGLYRERYAYRENITDVIIQHLTTGNKVRIKCHDRVQKIAIYKHRLAVQLPERVVVYEQGDADGMQYRVKEKVPQRSECSLLIATSNALLLCQDNKLSMIGKRTPKSWSFPAPIRYVKVTTLYFKEVLLLGLLNGQIWKIEPNEGEAEVVLATPSGVRCVDVSASRGRLAVVDDSSVCRVYCLPTAELLYVEENVSSVSWNSLCDELLCLSGGGSLSIKAGSFPAATQPLVGSVVGFQGGRVFCLQANAMQTINVPLSHAVHQYVQKKMFNDAYAVACLGVTALDWERLGMAATDELAFEVARKAFQRSENITYLTLIDQLQERFEAGEKRGVVVGEVLAYRGKYTDAANSFLTCGRDDHALNLYLDLRMFSKAQELVGEGEGLAALARRRAEWARHVSEPRAAAEMYLAVGDVRRAAQLMAENGRRDMLIELARKLDKGSSEPLRHVAEALVAVGEPAAAADVYQRLGDYRKVAQLAVSAGEWSRAFALAREHSDCKREVYLPYAHRMANENKFIEAQKAYHMAGESATAMRVFSVLVGNAVAEERFADAGYLHHLLAVQCLDTAATANGKDREGALLSWVLDLCALDGPREGAAQGPREGAAQLGTPPACFIETARGRCSAGYSTCVLYMDRERALLSWVLDLRALSGPREGAAQLGTPPACFIGTARGCCSAGTARGRCSAGYSTCVLHRDRERALLSWVLDLRALYGPREGAAQLGTRPACFIGTARGRCSAGYSTCVLYRDRERALLSSTSWGPREGAAQLGTPPACFIGTARGRCSAGYSTCVLYRDRERALLSYERNARRALVYHAYEAAHRCVHEPFSLSQPDALLNAARYALARIDTEPPPGVSLLYPLSVLCAVNHYKHSEFSKCDVKTKAYFAAPKAKTLNANSLAQQMLDKILNLQIPQKFQESVELLILKSRANAVSGDNQDDEVSPLCWRCRRHGPPLCATRCPHCHHQLTHSIATFEVLPLVEFEPAEGVTTAEALDLIERTPLPEATTKQESGDAEILRIDHDIDSSDPFLDKIEEDDETGVVLCSRNALLRLNPASVVTLLRPPLPPRFYRNMLPELPVAACPHCQNLFYMEDYEIQLVTKGHCPFCRHEVEGPSGEDAEDGSAQNGSGASTPESPSNGHTSWR